MNNNSHKLNTDAFPESNDDFSKSLQGIPSDCTPESFVDEVQVYIDFGLDPVDPKNITENQHVYEHLAELCRHAKAGRKRYPNFDATVSTRVDENEARWAEQSARQKRENEEANRHSVIHQLSVAHDCIKDAIPLIKANKLLWTHHADNGERTSEIYAVGAAAIEKLFESQKIIDKMVIGMEQTLQEQNAHLHA
jgi:hypothetical protein